MKNRLNRIYNFVYDEVHEHYPMYVIQGDFTIDDVIPIVNGVFSDKNLLIPQKIYRYKPLVSRKSRLVIEELQVLQTLHGDGKIVLDYEDGSDNIFYEYEDIENKKEVENRLIQRCVSEGSNLAYNKYSKKLERERKLAK